MFASNSRSRSRSRVVRKGIGVGEAVLTRRFERPMSVGLNGVGGVFAPLPAPMGGESVPATLDADPEPEPEPEPGVPALECAILGDPLLARPIGVKHSRSRSLISLSRSSRSRSLSLLASATC